LLDEARATPRDEPTQAPPAYAPSRRLPRLVATMLYRPASGLLGLTPDPGARLGGAPGGGRMVVVRERDGSSNDRGSDRGRRGSEVELDVMIRCEPDLRTGSHCGVSPPRGASDGDDLPGSGGDELRLTSLSGDTAG
jgi:hypothetical protein